MSKVCIHKLAQIFQQVLPGMFQESGVEEVFVNKQQDREGNLYWPCFYCKNPVRDEEGFYVTDEADLENVERYTRYEETLSEEDKMSPEKLVDARMAADEFYNRVREVVQDIIRDINALSEEELKEATQWSMKDSEIEDKFKRIGIYYRNMLNKIEFLFDKHYYYERPDIYQQLSDVRNQLSNRYGYWPHYNLHSYHYWGGGRENIKSRLYKEITDILNEAAERYQVVRNVVTTASQIAGTKKHLIQRHTINHPVCDDCHGKYGSECYAPSCNFMSKDIDEDFHKVKVKVFDDRTNKVHMEERLYCDEHGFKCDSCGEKFVKDPYEVFGHHGDDSVGYGARYAFDDPYCDNCFSEIFDYCEECNEVFHREDLLYDEKNERMICPQCEAGGARKGGIEDQLSDSEVEDARRFAQSSMGVGDVGYPIDPKAINTQILPALRKIGNKRFRSFEQWQSWLMKRVQSKDAKAAVMSEIKNYLSNKLSVSIQNIMTTKISDEEFEALQESLNDGLLDAFGRYSEKATAMMEKYPGLRGYKPLDVTIKVEKTRGHRGHAFAVYPSEKLLNYADAVQPGAREAYDRYLRNRGHHPGALAYARFSRSNNKIVVDNLQTDLDAQAFSYELRNPDPAASPTVQRWQKDRASLDKGLKWWLTAIKKFWTPFMLDLLRQYGQKTDQKIYLTSYKMQKTKWRTLPERNKDIYERTPDTMGFRRKTVDVKPEDLSRQEYKMRRIAELVDMFCKLAKIESLPNINQLVSRMFAINDDLSMEGANWTHNLASALRILGRVANKPRKLEAVLEKFDPEDWIKRGEEPLKEISKLDEPLARDIHAILYGMLINPDFKEKLPSLVAKQGCKGCGAETFGDAYVRYSKDDKVIAPLCGSCAMEHDRKEMSDSEFLEQWAPDYKCEKCGYSGHPPEVGDDCPICGPVETTTMRTTKDLN
jgi:hypothetical protein